MNVVLINPPNNYELQANDPVVFKGRSQGCLPPLGLLYTASAIDPKHSVRIIDCQAQNISYDEAVSLASDADVIGISVMTFTLIDVKILITKIRERSDAFIVVGGPHIAIYPQESIEALDADYAVCGESELVINELLDSIPCSQQIFKSDGFVENLDDVLYPARTLIDNSLYYSVLSSRNPTTTMFSSRGCPFQCSFCDRPSLGKKFRSMSAKRVVDEIEVCKDLGSKTIMFYDDTFTVDKERVYKICDEIKRRNIRIDWDVRARVDTVDYDLLSEMKSAGCSRIHFGVESAVDKVLKALNKNITINKVEHAFENAKKVGIETLAYFMIGCPSENRDDLQKTLDYSMKLNADYVSFTIFTPFPHTELYRQALNRHFIEYDVWKNYAKHPIMSFKPPVWGEFFEREELHKILNEHLRKYYLSSKFIFKKLMKISSLKELLNLSNIAMKLIR